MPDVLEALRALPGTAPREAVRPAPYAVIGLGEGALPAELLAFLVDRRLTSSGTQFVLASSDAATAAADFARIAEASGATVHRFGHGNLDELQGLVERGVLSTYYYAQRVARATGHDAEADEAERLLALLAGRCAPEVQEGNPARELAWTLWTRTPLLLAGGDSFLAWAWQVALARVGKSLSIPVDRDPLLVLTGAFEARHESADGRVALLLGDEDAELALAREVLETRVDEVVHVPFVEGVGGYAGGLAQWYFALWVAAYLAERYGVPMDDSAPLREVFTTLAGRAGDGDLD